MAAGLAELTKFIFLFAHELAQFDTQMLDLKIRLDYVEPMSITFYTWRSYALLPNKTAILLKEREVPCPSGSCLPKDVLIYEDYDSYSALVIFSDGAVQYIRIPPLDDTDKADISNGTLSEVDMSIAYYTSDDTINLEALVGGKRSPVQRKLPSPHLEGSINGFDRCELARLMLTGRDLLYDKLFDMYGNEGHRDPVNKPLQFCFQSFAKVAQTQFYTMDMMEVRMSGRSDFNASNITGAVAVQFSTMPQRMAEYWHAKRLSIAEDTFNVRMLTAFLCVVGVVYVVVDVILIVFVRSLRREKKNPPPKEKMRVQYVVVIKEVGRDKSAKELFTDVAESIKDRRGGEFMTFSPSLMLPTTTGTPANVSGMEMSQNKSVPRLSRTIEPALGTAATQSIAAPPVADQPANP